MQFAGVIEDQGLRARQHDIRVDIHPTEVHTRSVAITIADQLLLAVDDIRCASERFDEPVIGIRRVPWPWSHLTPQQIHVGR